MQREMLHSETNNKSSRADPGHDLPHDLECVSERDPDLIFRRLSEVFDKRDGGEGEVGVFGECVEEGFRKVLFEFVLQNGTADGYSPYLRDQK